jgi:hypothetical protein
MNYKSGQEKNIISRKYQYMNQIEKLLFFT